MCVPRRIRIVYDDYIFEIEKNRDCRDGLCINVFPTNTCLIEDEINEIARIFDTIRRNKELIHKLFDELHICDEVDR